ncbi:YMGG-like glycine zipper-containing protein [Cupriavidus basilensis]|uniref:Glycine zipper family protein n=1 Tax=Cupriavidus basilensis TaxID=68895 RepID=A0A7M2GXN5_9BURK|nr:YMGG-like glycine zipper-containing protein [Cupriavidus basilensis]QOT77501.1 glycine zipper family protein [Cupriavidus basilensis]
MQRTQRIALGLMICALASAAGAQQPIIYPAKGQSPQKQSSDTAACQQWAKQTTGVDPVAIAQQSGQPAAPPQQGGRVRGAAGGAAAGAAIGAIAGDAGKGAAIGAVTGTAAGGVRQRRKNEAAAEQQQAGQQQVSQEMATFNRAVGACMTGRGYTVQ